MPETRNNPLDASQIERPSCPQCGLRMWLSELSAPVRGKTLQKFECPACEVGPESTELPD